MRPHKQQLLRTAARLKPRRLLRWFKARALLAHRHDLRHQLEVLREHMSIDAALAKFQGPRFLRDPVLRTRMASDVELERALSGRLDAVERALAHLGMLP